jgi:hypothetical protein
MNRIARVGGGLLLVIVLFCLWYSVAANYDYDALAGTYVFNHDGEVCTLYLRPDHTFEQQLNRSGNIGKSEGQWFRYGESHVSFSKDFLKISGEELSAAGEAHGQFEKSMFLLTSLTLAPIPNGPTFKKKFFR